MTALEFDFPSPTARRGDPGTSHLAASRASIRAGTNRARAFEALLAAGMTGLTDFELAEATGVAQTSIGVRRLELERAGYVEYAEMTRPSPSGCSARVYRAVSR